MGREDRPVTSVSNSSGRFSEVLAVAIVIAVLVAAGPCYCQRHNGIEILLYVLSESSSSSDIVAP